VIDVNSALEETPELVNQDALVMVDVKTMRFTIRMN